MSLGPTQLASIILGTTAIGAGGYLVWRQWQNQRAADQLEFSEGNSSSKLAHTSLSRSGNATSIGTVTGLGRLIPEGATEIPVYSAAELIERLNLASLLNTIRSKSALTHSNFDNDCLPVLHQVMELVQLFPASESHHHANPGGLLVHGLETLSHALSIRQGVLLPQGAQPEDIQKHQHRWTYAIFLGALLHDIGKPLSDLNIKAFAGRRAFDWHPITGNLLQCGASGYRLQFRESREYSDHQSLAVTLMQRLVPQHAMQWLAAEPGVLKSLLDYLSGNAGEVPKLPQPVKSANAGAQHLGASNPIAQLVSRADQESVRHNLATGSRQRFAAARSIPLIERLMGALREMLVEGGVLPLNRKGAVGWVFEGEVWFVSKRLVDEIRAYLLSSNRGSGFPSADRNDRLFDTLQEFGAVISNPMTHRAIWSVRIEQNDGWSESFTVLRFPLAKLFESESLYPSPMQGVIRIQMRDELVQPIFQPTAITPSPITGLPNSSLAVQKQTEPALGGNPAGSVQSPSMPNGIVTGADRELSVDLNAGLPVSEKSSANVPETSARDVQWCPIELDEVHQDAGATNAVDRFTDEDIYQRNAALALAQSPPAVYLNSKEMAQPSQSSGQVEQAQAVKHFGRTAPTSIQAVPTLLAPVTPALPSLPKLVVRQGKGKSNKAIAEPPPLATQFMRWLQEGVASGDIGINHSKAQVHFAHVEHASLANEGSSEKFMLLVSPLIFRNFASSIETGDALAVQKEFFKAGWHVSVSPGNVNVLRFLTNAKPSDEGNSNASGGHKSLLSCIAVRNPERFVNPLPAINEVLTYSHELTAKPAKQKMMG
jgi:integrating conjugative element relaxase (TIGR03760 family)